MNSEKKIYQVPEFSGEHIPVKEVARIMGKDYQVVHLTALNILVDCNGGIEYTISEDRCVYLGVLTPYQSDI